MMEKGPHLKVFEKLEIIKTNSKTRSKTFYQMPQTVRVVCERPRPHLLGRDNEPHQQEGDVWTQSDLNL